MGPLTLVSVVGLDLFQGGDYPLWSIALRGGSAADLSTLGHERSEREDSEGAIVLYRAAADIPPQDPFYRALLAQELAFTQRCGESRVELERARAAAREEDESIDTASERVAFLCGAAAGRAEPTEP